MSKMLTRTYGSEELIANIGYEGVEVTNSFDSKYPWSEIQIIEENGEKWVRIPAFYTYYEIEDGIIKGRAVSQYKINDDWFINPLFVKDDRTLPYIDIAAYLMSYVNSTAMTRSGDTPIKAIAPNTARQYAMAKSDDTYDIFLYNIWALQILQDLFTVEFATSNCQDIMSGYLYDYYKDGLASNGSTDSVEYVTGCPTEAGNVGGTRCIKYRGIENVWGNGSTFVDGLQSYGNSILVCSDPTKCGDSSSYTESSITKLASSGVVYQLGFDSTNKLVFPIAVNSKGAYHDTYNASSSTAIMGLYSGSNSSNIGLWTYDISSGYNASIPQGTFRLVRRLK